MSPRRLEALGGFLLLAVGATALTLASSGLGSASARSLTASASGAMRIAGSSANQAILSAANLQPGEAVRGTADIRNSGKVAAALTLAPRSLGDIGGAGGGALSTVLQLTIRDVSGGSEAILYSGPFGALHKIRVGALAPGERRRYSFTAVLPDAGPVASQDAFAGARTSVDYRWALAGRALARCATRLSGDGRANHLIGTIGGDRIEAGAGDDTIQARDGAADVVDCGGGDDVATVDPKDTFRGCETLRWTS